MKRYLWTLHHKGVNLASGVYYNRDNIQMLFSVAEGGHCIKTLSALSDLLGIYPRADSFWNALMCDDEQFYSSTIFGADGALTAFQLNQVSHLMHLQTREESECVD